MAIDITQATPLSLKKDQELLAISSLNSIVAYNDSALKTRHYRTIPNDVSNEGSIKWANLPSVLLQDGDYAIAVSMFEYIYTGDYGVSLNAKQFLEKEAENGTLTTINEKSYYVQKDAPVYIENSIRVLFRKLVWVRASDLFLGSVAQLNAAEIEAEKKRQQELIDLANANKKPPTLGNGGGDNGSSTTTWIIVGIVFVFIAGIWALISSLSKKRKKQEEIEKSNASQVNVIRIPKNT